MPRFTSFTHDHGNLSSPGVSTQSNDALIAVIILFLFLFFCSCCLCCSSQRELNNTQPQPVTAYRGLGTVYQPGSGGHVHLNTAFPHSLRESWFRYGLLTPRDGRDASTTTPIPLATAVPECRPYIRNSDTVSDGLVRRPLCLPGCPHCRPRSLSSVPLPLYEEPLPPPPTYLHEIGGARPPSYKSI